MAKRKPIFDVEKARQSIETGKRARWWQRKGSKSKGFKYFANDGKEIKDEQHLARKNSASCHSTPTSFQHQSIIATV